MRFPFWRRKREEELDEELNSHLQMAAQDFASRGRSSKDARTEAQRQFGNVDLVKEAARQVWGLQSLETLFKDLRYALRMLVKYPTFTAVAVLSLALGIGANTAIFSVVNVLLFKPLPYSEPNRLMVLSISDHRPAAQGDNYYWSYPAFTKVRDDSISFEDAAAYSDINLTMVANGEPEKERGEIVTASYFETLGVKASIGRVFLPEEDKTPDGHAVVVLGNDLWQRRFSGDSSVIGKEIYLNKAPYTIVGVLPPGFRGQSGTADFWTPMMMAGTLRYPNILNMSGSIWLKIILRLKKDVSVDKARSELPVIKNKVVEVVPQSFLEDLGGEFKLVPLKETKVDPAVTRAFSVLLAAVGCVLLIACLNIANLLLARAIARQKEFAVRTALGAGRNRLIRQVLTESVLLSTIGGAFGLLIGFVGIKWLVAAKPWNTTNALSSYHYALTFDYFKVELDWRVLLFNFAVALITGVIFGAIPARQAGRVNVNEILKQSTAASVSGFGSLRRPSMRGFLVVMEVALSLVLLIGAGLLIKTVSQLSAVNLGFDADNVITMTIGGDHPAGFNKSLLERLQSVPGVQSVSFADVTPLTGFYSSGKIQIEDRDLTDDVSLYPALNVITPAYFKTLGIKLLKGRNFDDRDTEYSPHVAIFSRHLAEQYWPGQDPIGKRIKANWRFKHGAPGDWIEVVGVVDDVKYEQVENDPTRIYYFCDGQPTMGSDVLSVRGALDTSSLVTIVRREVAALDRAAPIYDVTTMKERTARSTSRFRYSAVLMGVFAGLALMLGAIGIYGVVGFEVSARTRELGIRVALGARPFEIVVMVITDCGWLIAAGLTIGVLGALATTRVLTSQLYQVRATDPIIFILTAVLLTAVAFFACYLPAKRASRIDPMTALRCE